MKRLSKRLVSFLVVLVTVFSGIPMVKSDAAAKVINVSYLALGDSLTDYASYEGKAWTSYPVYIAEDLEKSGLYKVDVKNNAVGGFTADDLVNQLKTDTTVINNVKNADVITVVIGGNDYNLAMVTALREARCDLEVLSGSKRISSNSKEFKALNNMLGNTDNTIHKKYISSIDGKIRETISLIEKYNPDCKVGISINGYDDSTGVECVRTTFNMDLSAAKVLAQSVKTAIREMESFFIEVAEEKDNVYYVDLDEVSSTAYMQSDSSGKIVDPHPNYQGQLKIAENFKRDFLDLIDLSVLDTDATQKTVDAGYSFAAVGASGYSANNALLGTPNKLTVDASGVGAKVHGTQSISANKISLDWKPAKAAGVITGFSLWDYSNSTEILLRFEGTATSKINVCVGGNGKYISKSISLGFDASLAEHNYCVEFDEKKVVLTVDKKAMGTVDISNIDSPCGEVTPIAFSETASWVGKFGKKQVVSSFENFAYETVYDNVYSFGAVSSSVYSKSNASLGTVNKLSVNASGIGAKAYGAKSITSKKISFDWKPAKASGVITGFSLWDNSSATEILVRFEGTNTNKINVCVGGNGKYISRAINLGFDASLEEHNYRIEYDDKKVILTVDKKVLGTIDVSSVASPGGEVNPVIFIETASWVGTFGKKQAVSLFSNIH